MDDLLAARSQMAMSLAFHIVFACVGMAMPLLMVIAEALHLRTGKAHYLELARRWSKGTAVLFAVGAVSGTVLSFELGLLWPTFMEYAGPIVGMPFSLEGFAFFLEAIFLGIYLYGWDRVGPKAHLAAGAGVAICGVLSAVFVVTANAWMNSPAGFTTNAAGEVIEVRPFEAMLNPAAPTQVVHMVLAAFVAVGFAVAAIHAWALLRRGFDAPDATFHRKALTIAMAVGAVTALLQPISGDLSAKMVAETQPVKLAAMEGHFETERGAALRIGGLPDEEARQTPWSIEVPYLLSILAFADPEAEVVGLNDFPQEDWPPVAVTHIAFQIMVGCGMAMMLVGLLWGVRAWRRRKDPDDRPPRWLLWAIVACGPLGFVAVEAGWTVTEVGRQPWVIHGIMRTADAVTPMPGLQVPFLVFTVLYIFLSIIVVVLLKRFVFSLFEMTALTDDDEEVAR